MHEVSLVRSLLQQVAEIAAQQGAAIIEEVRVEIGPLAGVEPLLIQSAFVQLVAGSAAAGSQLVVDEVPLHLLCRACRADFMLEQFRFECPKCASRSVQVLSGDEFRLVSITVAEPAGASALPAEAAP